MTVVAAGVTLHEALAAAEHLKKGNVSQISENKSFLLENVLHLNINLASLHLVFNLQVYHTV